MKKMSNMEVKKELVNMLKIFNEHCKKNEIEYSLIGGSLIGAIRHNGMIPWDDDIDIILSKDNYLKLKQTFVNNSNYALVDYDYSNDFYFPFMKLMNLNTRANEHNSHKKIKDYGLFIDIFCYTEAPLVEKDRINFFKKIKFVNSLLTITSPFEQNLTIKVRILRIGKNILAFILGKNKVHKIEQKLIFSSKYQNSNYIVSNWPVYSYKQEIQSKNDILEYIDVEFEGLKVRAFKNYDNILRNTFGNYMKLPPANKRVNHNMEVFWVK